MQDPRRDITEVVKRLTVTSSPDVQLKTLQTYFTEDAAFDHPLCRVDPGHNSREKILEIYQWYKITSPKIELNVEEIAYDEATGTMYLTIWQKYHNWMNPFSSAPARLVTKLDLIKSEDGLYRIAKQYDFYQPEDLVNLIAAVFTPLVRLVKYTATSVTGVSAWAFQTVFGVWKPTVSVKSD